MSIKHATFSVDRWNSEFSRIFYDYPEYFSHLSPQKELVVHSSHEQHLFLRDCVESLSMEHFPVSSTNTILQRNLLRIFNLWMAAGWNEADLIQRYSHALTAHEAANNNRKAGKREKVWKYSHVPELIRAFGIFEAEKRSRGILDQAALPGIVVQTMEKQPELTASVAENIDFLCIEDGQHMNSSFQKRYIQLILQHSAASLFYITHDSTTAGAKRLAQLSALLSPLISPLTSASSSASSIADGPASECRLRCFVEEELPSLASSVLPGKVSGIQLEGESTPAEAVVASLKTNMPPAHQTVALVCPTPKEVRKWEQILWKQGLPLRMRRSEYSGAFKNGRQTLQEGLQEESRRLWGLWSLMHWLVEPHSNVWMYEVLVSPLGAGCIQQDWKQWKAKKAALNTTVWWDALENDSHLLSSEPALGKWMAEMQQLQIMAQQQSIQEVMEHLLEKYGLLQVALDPASQHDVLFASGLEVMERCVAQIVRATRQAKLSFVLPYLDMSLHQSFGVSLLHRNEPGREEQEHSPLLEVVPAFAIEGASYHVVIVPDAAHSAWNRQRRQPFALPPTLQMPEEDAALALSINPTAEGRAAAVMQRGSEEVRLFFGEKRGIFLRYCELPDTQLSAVQWKDHDNGNGNGNDHEHLPMLLKDSDSGRAQVSEKVFQERILSQDQEALFPSIPDEHLLLSHTRLHVFQTCPLQYHLKYVVGLTPASPPSIHMLLGRGLHVLCKSLNTGRLVPEESDLSAFVAVVEASLASDGGGGKETEQEQLSPMSQQQLRHMIEWHCQKVWERRSTWMKMKGAEGEEKVQNESKKPLWAEAAFRWSFSPNVSLQGVIDAVVEENDRIVIVDYKSQVRGNLTEKDEKQLLLYAEGYAAATGVYPQGIRVEEIWSGKQRGRDLDPDVDRPLLHQYLRQTERAIRRSQQVAKPSFLGCMQCGFRNSCRHAL